MIVLSLFTIGVVGVLLQPFFDSEVGILWTGDESTAWMQFAINIAGLLTITLWAGSHSLVLFGTLNYFNLLRIDDETELLGCDVTKHGESAYPVSAWNEDQYDIAAQTHPVMKYKLSETNHVESLQHGQDIRKRHGNAGTDNMAMETFD